MGKDITATFASARCHRADIATASLIVEDLEPTEDELALLDPELEVDVTEDDLQLVEEQLSQARKDNKVSSGDVVGLYFQDIRGRKLLTWEEEINLALDIEKMRKMEEKLSKPGAVFAPKQREELERDIEDGKMAREKLCLSNVRLAISIARRYVNRGVPLADLIQEANLGLWKAIEKYNHRRGFRFSTYATWWIRQAVSRAVSDHGRTIRIPVHTNDQLRRVIQIQQRYMMTEGRAPTAEDLAEDTGYPVPRVCYLMTLVDQDPDSLDRPVNTVDSDSCLGDFIEDKSEPVIDKVAQRMLQQKLRIVLDKLEPDQKMVILMRFGLRDGKEYSSAEIAASLGIALDDVRRLESRALYALRSQTTRNMLRDYNP